MLSLLLSAAFAADGVWTVHQGIDVRFGTMKVKDSYLREVFGEQGDVVKLEYGAGIRVAEVSMSLGFAQDMGWLQTSTGESSDEHDMFTLFPIEAGMTLRLDFFDEQWVVPTGRLGGNFWLWRENWYVPSSDIDSARAGSKLGWHWAAGGMLRLDAFDRKAASELQASTGIDDTFLVAEYRRNMMPTDADQLQLSGWEITGGLGFDF